MEIGVPSVAQVAIAIAIAFSIFVFYTPRTRNKISSMSICAIK